MNAHVVKVAQKCLVNMMVTSHCTQLLNLHTMLNSRALNPKHLCAIEKESLLKVLAYWEGWVDNGVETQYYS